MLLEQNILDECRQYRYPQHILTAAFCISEITLLTYVPSVLWHCWMSGWKGIRSVKKWYGYISGKKICIWPRWCHCHLLSLVSVNQTGFTVVVLAHFGSSGQRVVRWVFLYLLTNNCRCMTYCRKLPDCNTLPDCWGQPADQQSAAETDQSVDRDPRCLAWTAWMSSEVSCRLQRYARRLPEAPETNSWLNICNNRSSVKQTNGSCLLSIFQFLPSV